MESNSKLENTENHVEIIDHVDNWDQSVPGTKHIEEDDENSTQSVIELAEEKVGENILEATAIPSCEQKCVERAENVADEKHQINETLQQNALQPEHEEESIADEEINAEDMRNVQKTKETILSNITKGLSAPPSPSTLSTHSEPRTESAEETSVAAATIAHLDCMMQLEQQRNNYEQQLEQLRAAMQQKDNMMALFQRENGILEKEKQAFRKEKEMANKEKESIVIKFAMKEKLLLDAKKEKDAVEKQLAEAKKEIKNVSTRFQALNEEKSRITYMMDEKCNEVRKYQRECEKLKTDCGHLESKLKYHINKLNIETEAKLALEKKLEEEKHSPSKLEEKANEQLKMEYDANAILLKHEIANKDKLNEALTKEQTKLTERLKQLQEQFNKEETEKNQLAANLVVLQQEHESVQNAYSNEMLNSAKLRGQLDELQLLRTQNTLNLEKIDTLTMLTKEMDEKLLDNTQDLQQLHAREQELLSINKEISESIVSLQNEICLLKSKALGIEAENEILKKEQLDFDTKYAALKEQLQQEVQQRSEERQLLTKHLSEKTKLNETIKTKLENIMGDLEATQKKHSQVVKELQREIQKYKKSYEQNSNSHAQQQNTTSATSAQSPAKAFADSVRRIYCNQCQKQLNGAASQTQSEHSDASQDGALTLRQQSRRSSNHSGQSSRRPSDCSEADTVASSALAAANDTQGPSKKHLVERILRLQQATARQTEKIDFLENHTLSLVSELQKKSKVVQYYMLRDQIGALTSNKSDQHKTELAKYGGVMSAIYGGIKGGVNQSSMTLELSLEINKKLQAVLEDTLLKNITLKENLDVLGLEVDKLTRKLAILQAKN